jgi:hypothetical protein
VRKELALISKPILFVGIAIASLSTAHAATLTVGAGQTYSTVSAAVGAATAGDTIDILAGTYVDQTATVDKPLTIQGIGGAVIFTQSANTEISNLKAFLVINASATISGLTFQNASISNANGGNGAGIRYVAGDLVVRDSRFIGNQDGILATPNLLGTGTLTVANSFFSFNGQPTGPLAGFEHAIYAGYLSVLTVTDSVFEGTQAGHDIKSRAATSIVTGNTLDDGVSGTTSYAADFANGGAVTFTGNTVTQGANTENGSMIAYGAEGLGAGPNSFLVRDNSFTNTAPSSLAVNNFSNSVTADISCNSFAGVAQISGGPATLTSNIVNGIGQGCNAASPVAEPSSFAVLLTGGLAAFGFRRCRGPRQRR